MNRRKFFKWLGVGIAGAAVAPSAIALCEDPWCGSIAGEGIIPHDELHGADAKAFGDSLVRSYADYTSFSAFALAASIDDIVANAAKELGEAAGRDIAALQAQAFA